MILIKLLALLGFIYSYQEGGQGHKYMKKFVAPSLLAISVLTMAYFAHHLNLWAALGSGLYFLASNGFAYGDKFTQGKTWKKVLFRGLCGASWGLCGLLIGIGYGKWLLGALNLLLSALGSVIFGVLNPFPSKWGDWATRSEDIFISFFYSLSVFL